MLRNEERKMLIEAHEKGYKSKELADIFGIDKSSVNRMVRQYKKTGSYELRTYNCGRKSVLTDSDLKNISELIDANPDITINEIIEKLNLKIKNEAVRKAVIKMGYVYKKKSLHASGVNAPDVADQRNKWIKSLPELDKSKLVFLDESGVNTDFTRIYGRSLGGLRCVDNVPLSTPKNTTILSSIRLSGDTAYTAYQGGTTNENFIDYLKNVLSPTLKKDDIIVMDNMRTHHSKAVKKAIEELKLNVIYLPPYSPDFNPIEKMWSKIKSVLRKLKIRAFSELKSGVDSAFSCVTPNDCKGWFSTCFAG